MSGPLEQECCCAFGACLRNPHYLIARTIPATCITCITWNTTFIACIKGKTTFITWNFQAGSQLVSLGTQLLSPLELCRMEYSLEENLCDLET